MITAIVVSDTSPIRALAHLGQLPLLKQLFARILVPPAVAEELRRPTSVVPAMEVSSWPFIEVRAVEDLGHAARYAGSLHSGEAMAIALALEVGATHLLIDELEGRMMARASGLIPVGVLGVLVEAKKHGLIGEIRSLVERLKREIHFRVSDRVMREALGQAGEEMP